MYKEYERATKGISSFCLAATLFFYDFLNVQLRTLDSPLLSIILSLLASIGFYEAMFTSLLWIYKKYVHFNVFADHNIAGKWLSIVFVDNEKLVRFGSIQIDNDLERTYIFGGNYASSNGPLEEDSNFPKKDVIDEWQSEVATFIDRRLIFSYESIGTERSVNIRRGLAVFQLYGSPPSRMVGVWSDMGNLGNNGSAVFYKDGAQFKEFAKTAHNKYSKAKS